jgi:hypothetical protein
MLVYYNYTGEGVDNKRIQKHVRPYKLAQFYELKNKESYYLRPW